MKELVGLAGVVSLGGGWIAGVVLAKGFWSTVPAICFPPWAYYLVIERLMQLWGLV